MPKKNGRKHAALISKSGVTHAPSICLEPRTKVAGPSVSIDIVRAWRVFENQQDIGR